MFKIVPYRSAWRGEFEALGVAIREVLGGLALRIDHIGSTSVPELAAKDIIDIQVTVAALEAPVESALNRLGYQRLGHIDRDHVPPGGAEGEEQWRKWIFNAGAGRRTVNLHVRVAGRANQRYPILFRDYLRAHVAAAQAYTQVKMALARLHPNDANAYYDVKDPVCDIIIGAAEAWAKDVGWVQGASDC